MVKELKTNAISMDLLIKNIDIKHPLVLVNISSQWPPAEKKTRPLLSYPPFDLPLPSIKSQFLNLQRIQTMVNPHHKPRPLTQNLQKLLSSRHCLDGHLYPLHLQSRSDVSQADRKSVV